VVQSIFILYYTGGLKAQAERFHSNGISVAWVFYLEINIIFKKNYEINIDEG